MAQIEIETSADYNLIKIKGILNGSETPGFLEIYKTLKEDEIRPFLIINMSECSEASTKSVRDISQLYLELKKTNKQIRLINVNDGIQDMIKKNGLDRILIIRMSLRGALVDFGLATKREIDAKFINPFLEATMKVLKIQCFMEVKPGKPFLKKADSTDFLGDVSGVIGIVSDTFNGALGISFPESVFCMIATNMLGSKVEKVNNENVDMVGELSNIILGQAKLTLLSQGFEVKQAIPTVIHGHNHNLKYFSSSATIVLPFELTDGTSRQFFVQICSSKIQEDKPAVAA